MEDKRLWQSMDDAAFDAALSDCLPPAPSEEAVQLVTPWRRGMHRVLWGFALSAVTLNVLWLQYLLPAVGVILCLLGFRTLRRENGWFRAGFYLSAVRVAVLWGGLILGGSLWEEQAWGEVLTSILTIAGMVLVFAVALCLRGGLGQIGKSAGLPAGTGAATAMLVWYGVVLVLALVNYTGLLVPLAILAAYVLILRSLFRVARAMDEAGYAVHAAPVRVPDRTLALVLAGALAVGIVCAALFGGSYPMDWQSRLADGPDEALTRQLTELGFPGDVLADMTAEELESCRGAKRVYTETDDHTATRGRTLDDAPRLHITHVAVELEDGSWQIIQHFRWLKKVSSYGSECIQLWPAYRDRNYGDDYGFWQSVPGGEVTGRLLSDRQGQTFTAPYYRLAEETYESSSWFFGTSSRTDVFASFSFQRGGEDQRGYLTYRVEWVGEVEPGLLQSWMNYTHQSGWLQYPVRSAYANVKSGSWNSGAFVIEQCALQYWLGEE